VRALAASLHLDGGLELSTQLTRSADTDPARLHLLGVGLLQLFIQVNLGSALASMRIRIQHFMAMRIQIRIQCFDDQKLKKKNSHLKFFIYFLVKNCM
jgi:hypothetical protein